MPSGIELSQLNPLRAIGIGTVGMVVLVLVLAIVFLGLVGTGIWWYVRKKQFKYSIPLRKKLGNSVFRIATYKAKDFKIGFAGDKLWYVAGANKYISPAVFQSAPNEYEHFEREDGEWINVSYPDVDEIMKKNGVKYVHQDMRSTRVSIGEILEQRFKNKQSFWEKYGMMITYVIFYLVVAVAMVIIFYQFSQIVSKISALFDRIVAYEQLKVPVEQGIVPVAEAIGIFFMGRKK